MTAAKTSSSGQLGYFLRHKVVQAQTGTDFERPTLEFKVMSSQLRNKSPGNIYIRVSFHQTHKSTNTYRLLFLLSCIILIQQMLLCTFSNDTSHHLAYQASVPSTPKFPALLTPHTEWVVPNDKLVSINLHHCFYA